VPQGSKPAYGTAVFLGSTAFVFLNFGLPIRADDLGMSAVAIGGMYTVFTGTMLLVRPLVGYCLDRIGRRWFFTSAFFFYAIAMSVFAGSSGEMDFYLARFLQGIGASLMWVSARTIVADTNDQSSRGVAMGRLTTTSVRGSMMGAFYGFTLLGFMPLPLAWVWAFSGYALMAGVALIWSLLRVEETWVRQESSNTNEGLVFGVSGFMSPGLWRVFVVVLLSAFASALIEPIYLLYLKNKFAVGM